MDKTNATSTRTGPLGMTEDETRMIAGRIGYGDDAQSVVDRCRAAVAGWDDADADTIDRDAALEALELLLEPEGTLALESLQFDIEHELRPKNVAPICVQLRALADALDGGAER